MTCNCKNTDELRIVRGNGFSMKIDVEARRLDGSLVDSFDLSQADATLKLVHYGEKTSQDFIIEGNSAIIAFGGSLLNGWYGFEMSGTFDYEPWRWCVKDVFQIVETNEKANIPTWTFLAGDTYTVTGVLTLMSGGGGGGVQVQADWDETSVNSPAYIKNKPTIPAAQVNSDWNANSGVAQILNKPDIPAAQVNSDWNANSGVAQILNKPDIPAAQVNADWNANSGVAQILNKPVNLVASEDDDGSGIIPSGGGYVCTTEASTSAKTVNATGYVLAEGVQCNIRMVNANTANGVTLNINDTGAKALYYNGVQASTSNSWVAGEVLEVYYDGTQYQCASVAGTISADDVKYDNSQSSIDADNVQNAIDELSDEIDVVGGYKEKVLAFSNSGRWTGYNEKSSNSSYACTPIVAIEDYTRLMYRTSINGTSQTIIFLFDAEGQTVATITNSVSNETNYGIIDLTLAAYSGVKYIAINARSSFAFCIAKLFSPMNRTDVEIDKIKGNLYGEVTIPYVDKMVFNPSGNIISANGSGASDYQDITGYDCMDYKGNGSGNRACVLFFDESLTIIPSLTIAETTTVSGTIDFTQAAYSQVRYVVVSAYANASLNFYMKLYAKASIGDRVVRLEKADYRGTRIYAALGDSITYGQGATDGKGSWYDRFLTRFGNTVSFKFATPGRTIRTFVDEADPDEMETVHTCFVMGGTNWCDGSEIGQLSDAPTPAAWQPNTAYAVGDRCIGGRRMAANRAYAYEDMYECIVAGTSSDNADATNFTHTVDDTQVDGTVTWKCIGCPSWYADLWKTYNTLTGWNPAMRVIFMSPIRQSLDINKQPSACTRYDAIVALKNFCQYNSIEYIDMREKMPINANTVSALLADQWHPTNAGYEIMCDIVSANV